MLKRITIGIVLVLLVGIVVLTVLAWRSELAPIQPSERSAFPPALIAKGAQLEALGDCNTCHTVPGGRMYAGGRPFETPFGTVYSTNITPDRETGIGTWSEHAFARAMREGLDREGRHLYPVFPYDHFRIVSGEDIRAIYAFLMTREPVPAEARANDLRFPLGFRPLLAGWKWLYLEEGAFEPDASHSDVWNRGAYLAEGLGHCGACHTPRNALGAVRRDAHFAGGQAEGWHAPALNASSPAPIPWTEERLLSYLRNEVPPLAGIPAGPMLPVAHNLALVPKQDVAALAAYVASVIGAPTPERQRRAEEIIARTRQDLETPGRPGDAAAGAADHDGADASVMLGRDIYAGACAICHDRGRGPSSGSAMHLALSTTIALPVAANLVHVIDGGITPRPGERGRWMPAFGGAFTNEQMVALARYVRATFSDREPWRDVDREVEAVRGAERRP